MATRKKPAAKAKAPAAKKRAVKKAPVRKAAPRKKAAPALASRADGEALRLAGIGTDAVAKATGKAWDRWLALLDKAGAVAMPHRAIAKLVAEKFGAPPWWSQMVAVGYEQARGLREVNQNALGYSATVSRTLAANLGRLYGAWADPALRSLWLGDAPVVVTRAKDGKSMRMKWTAGGSSVEVNFSPAGAGKSRVAVEHARLGGREDVDEKKHFWAGALGRLKALLEKAA